MQKKILGLDICEGSISMVLIKSGLRENQVLFYKHVLLPSDNDGATIQQVTETLENIKQNLPVPHDSTFVSIPSGMISFRNLETPFKDHQKIRKVLPFELEPTLPSPVDNLVIDFFLTGHHEENHLVAASLNRDIFETYIDNLSKIGFDPSYVSPSGYATVNSLIRYMDLPAQSMVLHLDRCTFTVYELIYQKMVLIRSFRVTGSGESRMESIARNLQQTIAASEDILFQEFFPEHLWLTGNSSDLDLISDFLRDKLQIPNSKLDFLSVSNISGEISIEKQESTVLNNALGLALSEAGRFDGINFRKGRYSVKNRWTEHKATFVRTGVIAVLTVMMFFSILFYQNRLLQNRLDTLNQEINQIFITAFPEVTRIIDPVHQMQIHVEEAAREKQISGYGHRAVRAVDILNQLSKQITYDANAELTQLVLGPENLQLSGTADTFNTVNEIRNRLDSVPFFKQVMISSATVERSGERIQFKINIDF